jgi:hypothetical protein
MDVHGTLQGRIGCLGVHGVEYRVDRFIASCSLDRGAEDLARCSVNDDLHETCVSPFSTAR